MTIKIIEVLLPLVKSPGFIGAVDFQDLVTYNITLRHFDAAQNIVIENNRVELLQEKFQKSFGLHWNNAELRFYKTLEIFSIFSQNDVKRLVDKWSGAVRALNPQVPDQEDLNDNNSQKTSGNLKARLQYISRSGFEKIWNKAFVRDREDQEYSKETLFEYILDAFGSQETEKLDFR